MLPGDSSASVITLPKNICLGKRIEKDNTSNVDPNSAVNQCDGTRV